MALQATRLVFASSQSYRGNLGGLAGADAKCPARADAAGLPGTYRAWLSTATESAGGRMTPSTLPYVLVNGVRVAANFADLVDGTLENPISVTEKGVSVSSFLIVWTATNLRRSPGTAPARPWKGARRATPRLGS